MNEKDSKALEAMLWEHDKDLVIFESFLPHIRARYHISNEYDLHVPKFGQQPFDLSPNWFELSVDALEAGLRFPLHPLGRGSYYLISNSGFRVCGVPSNNKGWKSYFFFVSAFRSWGFGLKWIDRGIDNSPPLLTKDEVEQVVRLRRIISSSKVIKSMKEASLVEAGLHPTPMDIARFVLLSIVLCRLP
ncbi:hypothetical protein BHE74_00008302 [Ensete ventricosum]|nr:hypothetical protein GW17_00027529 [Ensete ventricosum]RWW83199.1 hypothetical protein BHE74_00008302 [Ensete ventricosum]RZR92887.1 hypothetical protein BHM03_00021263 [Ensete ventricosum]